MSWDIYIQDLPQVRSVAEIPEDFTPGPIGRTEELVSKILEVIPFAKRQGQGEYVVDTPLLSLTISLSGEGDLDKVDHIAIHVHDGKCAGACVAAIISHLGLKALDTGTGEFFDVSAPDRGYSQWQEYRNHITKGDR